MLTTWLRDALDDLWFGCRRMLREPGATAAIVLVLASGIALSAAIFSVADTVLRRPLPVRDEQRVVVLWGRSGESPRTLPLTAQHFERYRSEARALREVAGTISIDSWAQPVRDGDQTFRVNLSPVTGNFFDVLGSPPVLGRTLTPADDHRGADPVAVLSYALWQGRFGGDPGVLGKRLELRSSRVVTVVGVASPGLEYPKATEIWVPFTMAPAGEVVPIGRLADSVTEADAAAEFRASLERESTSGWRGLRGEAVPLSSLIVGDVRSPLLLLTGAAALLLLTACFNVSNLLLLRGAARQHEIAVRHALGANRGRIVRLLVVESLPVAALAGFLGAWASTALVQLLAVLAPGDMPRLLEVQLQGVPVGLAVLITAAAALGSSVMPALWLARGGTVLLSGRRTTTPSATTASVQRSLVVFQVGLAVLVLFVAGLVARTLQSLYAIDTGLAAPQVAVIELSWPDSKFAGGPDVVAMYERLLPRIEALPDVAAVATVNVVPFTGATVGWDGPFVADAQGSPASVLNFAVVGTQYFDTMAIRPLAGRIFHRSDRRDSAPVAVISEGAARLLGLGTDAVGRRMRFGGRSPGAWRTIVGVVPENRYRAIREPIPTAYLPIDQFPEVISLVNTLVVRTEGRPAAAVRSIREAITQSESDVTVLGAAPLDDLVAGQFRGPRLNAVLISVFGAGATLLAAVGLYSVLAAAVRMRRRELAIRQAIGATPGHLRRAVVVQGAWLCGAGLAFGLASGLASGRLLGGVLYGVAPNDLRTVIGVASLLVLVSAAACYLPARHATRPDLTTLLRD